MKRFALQSLKSWLELPNRKPLVLRGARQVGKTWLVRHFAILEKKSLIELNFEKDPNLETLFNSNDPKQILLNIEIYFNQSLVPQNTLLFLDEIQAAPILLSKLRWFAEEMSELAIVATGSLLEFVLEEHSFSIPVGRINFMYLEPLSFEEFILANNHQKLYEFITSYHVDVAIPEAIHFQLMSLFKEYILIGGMPGAVAAWIENKNLMEINQIHNDLLATYRDDFAKYKGRLANERLDEIITAIPRMLSEKFVYSKINRDIQSISIKNALNLLTKARLCHKVLSSSANGVPPGAEINEKNFKVIFIDVGLVSALLGLKLYQLNTIKDIELINQGSIAEQVCGQLLRTIEPYYIEPHLYYWLREVKGSNAEVDYVIQHDQRIVPIEVKSGSEGALKSLHLFMSTKQLRFGLRIYSGLPLVNKMDVQTTDNKPAQYSLLSLPFYLIGQIPRIIERLDYT